VGSEDGFRVGGQKLWPLGVECDIPDDRYIIVFGVHIEELAPALQRWQAALTMLRLGTNSWECGARYSPIDL
jgi:hypothetical protein